MGLIGDDYPDIAAARGASRLIGIGLDIPPTWLCQRPLHDRSYYDVSITNPRYDNSLKHFVLGLTWSGFFFFVRRSTCMYILET